MHMLSNVVLTSSIQARVVAYVSCRQDGHDSVPSTVLISSSVATTAVDSQLRFPDGAHPSTINRLQDQHAESVLRRSTRSEDSEWNLVHAACVPIKMLVVPQACSRPGCTRPRHVTKIT
jgi:hypothetical protein